MKIYSTLLAISVASLIGCGDLSTTPDDSSSSSSVENSSSSEGSSSSSQDVVLSDSTTVSDEGVYGSDSTVYILGGYYNGDLTFGPNARILVKANVYMNGTLTLEKGTKVLFSEETYMEINNGGNLIANGVQDSVVVFKPVTSSVSWGYGSSATSSGGLYFESDAGRDSRLTWAIVDGANTGITVEQSAALELDSVTVKNSEFYGLYLKGDGSLSANGMSGCTFENNDLHDVLTEISNVESFGQSNSFAEGVEVSTSYVDKNLEIPAINAPYKMTGTIYVTNSSKAAYLTIDAGVEMRFAEGKYLEIAEMSALKVEGTQEAPVYFGPMAHVTNWGYGSSATSSGGIYFETGALAESTIEYAIIDSANTAITTETEHAFSIKNSVLKNSEFYGIRMSGDGQLASNSIDSCTFTNNGIYDAFAKAEGVGAFTAANIFTDSNGVEVKASTLASSAVWNPIPAPYIIQGYIYVENDSKAISLEILAGTELRFAQDAYINIDDGAKIVVSGDSLAPVQMLRSQSSLSWGFDNDSEFAGGIFIDSKASADNTIDWLVIDGASTGIAVRSVANALALSNTVVKNCSYYGLYIGLDASLSSDVNNTYIDNGLGDVLNKN